MFLPVHPAENVEEPPSPQLCACFFPVTRENPYRTICDRHASLPGDRERFDILKVFLVAEQQAPSGAAVAARLGLTEAAVYSAVHRLRNRYGEILREEIAHTVNSANEIEDELRFLVQVLSR